MIEIDGSFLEGGGQIIRTALALSAVTQKACRILNIRAKRPNPGLREQHLQGVKALAKMCSAKVKGAKIGSTELVFVPGKLRGGKFEINIATAGSVGLIFQIISLPAAFCEESVEIEIKGGATYGKFAPPLDYIKMVLLPFLEKLGYKAEVEILNHGFYPKGGARARFFIEPWEPVKEFFALERKGKEKILAVSVASSSLQERKVAERQANIIREYFPECKIEIIYSPSLNPGSGVTISALFENCALGGSGIGERGKRAEDVAKEACEELRNVISSQACADEHAGDQLLPFLAFCECAKISVSKISTHAKTNAWVIEKFLPVKFEFFEKALTSEILVTRR